MWLYLPCLQCSIEHQDADELQAVEFEDSNLYRTTCARGHETVTCLQQMKFELLFDFGVSAIVDGYYRDAIASFAAGLERFYDFYVRFQCSQHGVDDAAIESAWKNLSPYSERQLGAFIAAHLMEEKSAPRLLPPRAIKLRNAVIHHGKIPSREEAIQFGEQAAEIVNGVLSVLRAKADNAVNRAVGRYVNQVAAEIKAKAPMPYVVTMCKATMISLARARAEPVPTVREHMRTLEEVKKMFRAPGDSGRITL